MRGLAVFSLVVVGAVGCTGPSGGERAGELKQKIINGDETLTGSEDVVQITCRAGNQPLGSGTGTLLNNEWVLTAAHVLADCVDGAFNLKTDPNFTYSVGVKLPSGAQGTASLMRGHPRWLSGNSDFDVALIKLAAPIAVTDPDSGVASTSGHVHKISSRTPFQAAGEPGNENFLRCFGWGGFVPVDLLGGSCAGTRLPNGSQVPTDLPPVAADRLRHGTFKTVPELTGTGMVTLPWQTTVASLFLLRNTDPSLQPLGYQTPTKGDSGGPCGDATADFSREPIEGVMRSISLPLCDPTVTRLVPAAAFAPWVVAELGPQALGLMSYDLDLDGTEDDLQVTDSGGGTSNVHVALSSGIIPPFDFPLLVAPDTPLSFAFGFFNNDALPDVLTLGNGSLSYNLGSALGWANISGGPDLSQYPLNGGATWSTFETADINGDLLTDVLVRATDGTEQVFFAKIDGSGLDSTGAVAHVVAPIDADAVDDLVFVTVHKESGKRMLYMDTSFGPSFPLGIEWTRPERGIELLAADLDGSAARPGKELLLRVNGDMRYYQWNGFAAIEERSASVPRILASASLWVDDLKVDKATPIDGSPTVDVVLAQLNDFSERFYSGNPSGLPGTTAQVLDGLPTPYGDDGKYLDVSGAGNSTVAATEVRLKLAVGANAPQAAKDRLIIDLHDGDLGGLNDHGNDDPSGLKTCYLLTSDPCGNAGLGECDFQNAATQGRFVAAWDSDMMADDSWTRLSLPHACEASLLSTCPAKSAPYGYELRVFLKEREAVDPGDASDCRTPPAPNSVVPHAVISAFKVRSNAVVSHPEGQLSFEAFDTNGDFGTPWFRPSYMRDTDYDGFFEFNVSGSSAANEINLQEADADYLADDSNPGVATGANYDINYSLFDPNIEPVVLDLGAGADGVADVLVQNPSGNYDDSGSDHDVEVRRFAGPVTDGSYFWVWGDVFAHNNVHVWAPTGSPVTFELMGRHSERAKLTTAEPLDGWLASGMLETWLSSPVVLGTTSSSGALEGSSVVVSNAAQARSILQSTSVADIDRLLRELLLSKLNVRRAQSLGERLDTAMVYGVTASLRSTLAAADAAVRGPRPLNAPGSLALLARRLGAVNRGDVTYFRPGVPTSTDLSGDPDADGVMNLKDNCPPIANADQLDSDGDRVGDACRVLPKLDCVMQVGASQYRAYLGYDSPLEFRSIPIGKRNGFSTGAQDRGQPSEFSHGRVRRAFSVEFSQGQSVSWKLEDSTLTVDASSPACLGNELLDVPFASSVALFGHDELLVRSTAHVEAPASAVSSGYLELGGQGTSGSLFGRGNVALMSGAHVSGSVVVGGTLQRQDRVVIDGALASPGFVPEHRLDFRVTFPVTTQDANLEPGQTRNISPGSYRSAFIKTGATLVLAPGVYRFDSLRLEPNARLQLASGAQTTVYVRQELYDKGIIASPVGQPPLLLLGYFGTSDATIEASFRGALIAPSAKIVLGTDQGGRHEGAFFGKRVELRSGATVVYAALGGT